MHVVITGFMASGKTAVGRRLAKRLGWRFLDTDQVIEEREQRSIADIFASDGEAEFRRIERETIRDLDLSEPTVLSTGGGTFTFEENREELRRRGVVVCLMSSLPTLLERIRGGAAARPLASGPDAEERLAALLEERLPSYRMADVLVETDGLSVDQAVGRVLGMIEPRLKRKQRAARSG